MPLAIIHFLTYPTSSTYLCGADAVGRRNTRVDPDPANTSCAACLRHADHPLQPATAGSR